MCSCGTSAHGLAGMVVLALQLDMMILEVFSNLNDSMKKMVIQTAAESGARHKKDFIGML